MASRTQSSLWGRYALWLPLQTSSNLYRWVYLKLTMAINNFSFSVSSLVPCSWQSLRVASDGKKWCDKERGSWFFWLQPLQYPGSDSSCFPCPCTPVWSTLEQFPPFVADLAFLICELWVPLPTWPNLPPIFQDIFMVSSPVRARLMFSCNAIDFL